MSEPNTRLRRTPTTGFPLVPLQDAHERITEIARYGKEHSRTAFAHYLGHESAGSGPFKRKLAAYRDWGLVTTAANTVALTELAQRLAIPTDPNQTQADLLEAFDHCEPFVTVYESVAKGVDLEITTVANTAVHRVGIAPAARDAFADSFTRSAVAVGLAEQPGSGRIRLLPRDALAQPAPSADPERVAAVVPTGGAPQRPAPAQTSMSLPWSVEGGRVVLQIEVDRPLPPGAFSALATVSDAIANLLEALAVTAPRPGNAAGDGDGETTQEADQVRDEQP
jgi:hypothetical protein